MTDEKNKQACSVVGCDDTPAFLYAETLRKMDLMLPFCVHHHRAWENRKNDIGWTTVVEDGDKYRVMSGPGGFAYIDKRTEPDGGE